MKYLLGAVAVSLLTACSQSPSNEEEVNNQMQYPETRKGDVVDTYFGTEVADPYRWLEDDRSEETEAWVKAQNEVTFSHLEKIPFREKIEERLTELWNYEKVSAPRFEGGYIYFYKNDGLQNQYVVYRKKSEDAEAEVFLDPNKFSEDGTTSLAQLTFSEDGSIAAYSISEGGSDWRKIIVIDAETGDQHEEPLVDVKFSGISWKGNEGFYYSSYDKPEGSELSAKTDQHKLYYHEIGTPQSEDDLIFGGTEAEKNRYVGGYVTEDDRFLVVSAANSTSGNKLYIKDLTKPDSELVLVDGDVAYDTSVLTTRGDTLYLETNMDAPNGRVVTVNAGNPKPDNWQDFIAHSENVLNPSTGAGYIFAEYMVDAVSKVEQYDYDGNKVRDIALPGVGSASGFSEKQDAEKVYYSFTNYSTPSTIYEMNPETGESVVYEASGADFDSSQYVSKQVFYTSKDGTEVPMIITHKKGLELDGTNPTILYGYGGFNISLTPSFSIANAAWLEMGGVYAVANLRGGGEYGKEWHKAGTKMQKQNVFDDFIAAAEYLIEADYTSSDRLAVRGGSNGGLLVGAVMTQRPELFAVALPAVGVLDMLRYHTFTAGAGWAYDYGTAEDSKEMFEYLLNYSPVHNVEQGVEYPATLITTGDHDDRVVPAHSFKFAAELQDKAGGDNPQLIRIETNAGHGAGTPVSKTIEQYSDIFGFTLYHMGFESLPNEK
ncbi:prolyl oligopeptidase family protein [Idiomarina piscisalsi]|uniref:prolyl oligopeptidase family serine peptidase n=1 Tax=Idiomarina piscisalsi TaxID=1096243 RepID=UPI0013802689|nr:prolyl oligopeptidase family serine peptidase [Idiomarina piscisalsi]MTJ01701.1 S9 family peptidase [Idiomarina piscisalsi]